MKSYLKTVPTCIFFFFFNEGRASAIIYRCVRNFHEMISVNVIQSVCEIMGV